MRRDRWKTWLLVAALAVAPAAADEDVDLLIAYILDELESGQIACSESQLAQYAGKRVVCGGYSGSFNALKFDWDLIMRHTKLPLPITTDDAWTYGENAFRITYSYGRDGELHVALDTKQDQIHFAYQEEDVDDYSQGVRAASGGPLDSGKAPPPRVAGFGGVSVPRVIEDTRVEPLRSARAQEERVAGTVTLEIVVRADGTVSNVVALSASPEGYGFDISALEAVRRWMFEPALFEGQAIDSVHNLTLEIKQDAVPSSDGD